jgi:FkbM family methyltransferase
MPRGYGRALPALASLASSLCDVVIDTDQCGRVCLDFRELICLPLFVHGCYKHQLSEDNVLSHLLRPGMKVFDIGANIGYYTAYISRRVKDRGLVVAVEPMPRALRLLKKNELLCGANVVVRHAAVGPEPGQAEMSEMHKLDLSFVRFGQTNGGSSVDVITIDQLTIEHGTPDLLKIDVEGAELLALQGAAATLSDGSAPILMIEYIAENAARFGAYHLADLLRYFPKSRFKTYRIVVPGRLRELSKKEGTARATNDYLAVPLDKLAVVESLVVD